MKMKIRDANRADLPELVRMLADDNLGSRREAAAAELPQSYYDAFDAIVGDANNTIMVACRDGQVVGMLQLTYTPSLSYQGGTRATIESVRTKAALRGQGIGTELVQAAIARAQQHGCVMVQLTTHQSRTDAHRFYHKLGFRAQHVGMKLMLERITSSKT